MATKNEKSDSYKKNIKKIQGKIFDELAKNYGQTLDHGKSFGNASLEKISDSALSANDFIKSKHYWESLKNNSSKIKEKTSAHGIELKKYSPKLYEKIIRAFFYFFEALVGRIKIGSQYGTASLEVLERLAKLKELGILTDEEFDEKKKKILDRI